MDITKCSSQICPYRSKCWRYRAPSGMWQSRADFSKNHINKDGKCDAFWPIRKR